MTKIAVFCGSSENVEQKFFTVSKYVGKILANNNLELVFGGGVTGPMGVLAKEFLIHGGLGTGVMAKDLVHMEGMMRGLKKVIVADSLHERKFMMADIADKILLMPGGLGSCDEFFDVVTTKYVGFHEKEIIIFNIYNYWQPLLNLFEHFKQNNFAPDKNFWKVVNDSDQLVLTLKD